MHATTFSAGDRNIKQLDLGKSHDPTDLPSYETPRAKWRLRAAHKRWGCKWVHRYPDLATTRFSRQSHRKFDGYSGQRAAPKATTLQVDMISRCQDARHTGTPSLLAIEKNQEVGRDQTPDDQNGNSCRALIFPAFVAHLAPVHQP
jgi:hypothetical protein